MAARKAKARERVNKLLVLNGPNLERLGRRETDIYGTMTLSEINDRLQREAELLGVEVECRQSNHEGQLIDWISAAREQGFAGIVINPGALTHTSYAIFDALSCAEVPAVEVHLSNPEAREPFRRRSVTARACVGKIAGFGPDSYLLGLRGLLPRLSKKALLGR